MPTKEEIIEEVADVVEETLDVIENTQQVVKNNPKLLVAVAVLSAGGGAALAYFLSKKKLVAKYETEYAEKLEESKAFYRRNSKPPTPADVLASTTIPEEIIKSNQGSAVSQLQQVIRRHNYAAESTATAAEERDQTQRRLEEVTGQNVEVDEVAVIPEEVSNIFTNWDYDAEIAARTEEAPYIIHRDEFNGNETDYNQTTLTWYDEDGTLTDEKDVPIDDVDGTVGEDNMERFGHGSMDPNVVYIRNDKLELDAEVVRAHGSYAQIVFGVKHSDEPRRRRASRLGRDDE